MKNIEQLMAEADPVRTLSQTGSIRMLKRLAPESAPAKGPVETPAESAAMKPEPGPLSAVAPPPGPVAPTTPPPFQPAVAPVPLEAKKADPVPTSLVSTGAPKPEENDSPFILKPGDGPASIPKIIPPTVPSLTPFGSIFRRKAKMTELARIVLPPKREESDPPPAPSESSPTVVPPAFPVAAMTARAGHPAAEGRETAKASSPPPFESPAREKITAEEKPLGAAHGTHADGSHRGEMPPPGVASEAAKPASPEAPSALAPVPVAETKPATTSLPDLSDSPKIDPEAHRPEPSATPLPKVDPEAHKPDAPAKTVPLHEISPSPGAPEKREFHLANGERVAGTVLSETPEAVYLDHGTLGVLTIPRANIAKRLVEIILINGDRIVGDIMAETADTLYVRHASLGMLTVPRAQRSTRVVEAILKDGDRILGEVLTETDTFTVIRSATLGTVTVPHDKVSMLNRKVEQIELKALPPPAPEIKDKPAL
jgi:RNase P/RNase MRP subunit p29